MFSLAKKRTAPPTSGQASRRSATKPRDSGTMPAFLQRKTRPEEETRDSERHSEAHMLTSVAQLKVRVGPANDRYEQEADRVAGRVLAGSTAPMAVTPLAGSLQRAAERDGPQRAPRRTERAMRNKGSGEPLSPRVRRRVEPVLGSSLARVRLHRDAGANQAADALGALAFTQGQDIWLGSGQSADNVGLLAHEATHVVQQGSHAVPALQRKKDKCPGCEQEEEQQEQQEPVIQRYSLSDLGSDLGSAWEATGGRAVSAVGEAAGTVVNAAGEVVSDIAEAGADLFWRVVREVAPSFEPVLREIASKGVFRFFYDKLKDGVTGLFTRLGVDPAIVDAVFGLFESMTARVGEILVALSEGNCDPLFAALDQLKNTLSEMASDAWSAITDFFTPVGEFFSDLWTNYGAPVMDWLGQVAGDLWTELQNLGSTIWGWTEPVRSWGATAWDWVKEQLGMSGAGGDSEGGLMSWVSDKIGEVWATIREELAPVIEPVQQLVARIGELLPLDAITNLRDTVTQWSDQVGSMAESMNQPDGVAEQQTSLRETILPAVMLQINNLRTRLTEAGAWVAAKIGALASSVTGFIGGLRSVPLVSMATGAIGWLETKLLNLSVWAQVTVMNLFNLVGNGLVRLSRFIEPVLNVLRQIVEVVGDLAGRLPDLIMGPLWWILPACIREPIKNFLLNQILARIPIFSQLMAIPDAWSQIQATALRILRQVFVDGNLAQAAWTFFSSILRIFNIPPELVTSILANAAAAVGDILRNPVDFLINLLRAVREGFSRFFDNIVRHLLGGIAGWLFGHLSSAGITMPETFDLRGILGIVLQILDITRERIFRRLATRVSQAVVTRLQQALEFATGVWEWVATLMREGPGGLWRMLQDRLSNLWDTVLNGIISWLTTNIITRVTARLLSMLDPSGVMAVVNSLIAIYRAIQSFMEYLRQMLEIVNSVLSGIAGIARGAISQAAGFLESSLARAIPIAIGFLANQVGLGNLGSRIRDMVEGVRAQVDQAIDWIIDRALRLGRAALDLIMRGASAVRRGAARLRDWWRGERRFTAANGEQHRLYIQGQGSSARLMMASDPAPFTHFIDGLNKPDNQKSAARAIASQLDQKIAEASRTPGNQPAQATGTPAPDYAAEIEMLMNQLATAVAPLMDQPAVQDPLTADRIQTVPEYAGQLNQVTHGPGTLSLSSGASSQVGTSMQVSYLTHSNAPNGSDNTGPVQNAIYGFRKLPQSGAFGGRGYRSRQVYIKGHLLNANLGGPAQENNLYPITARANSQHHSQVERHVKRMVLTANPKLVVMYNVRVINQSAPTRMDVTGDGSCTYEYVNAAFNCSYATYRISADNQISMNAPVTVNIDSTFDEPGFMTGVRAKGCPQQGS